MRATLTFNGLSPSILNQSPYFLSHIFVKYYDKLLPLRPLVVYFLNKRTVIPTTDLSEQVRTNKGIENYTVLVGQFCLRARRVPSAATFFRS